MVNTLTTHFKLCSMFFCIDEYINKRRNAVFWDNIWQIAVQSENIVTLSTNGIMRFNKTPDPLEPTKNNENLHSEYFKLNQGTVSRVHCNSRYRIMYCHRYVKLQILCLSTRQATRNACDSLFVLSIEQENQFESFVLLNLCGKIHQWYTDSHHEGPVMRSSGVFYVVFFCESF